MAPDPPCCFHCRFWDSRDSQTGLCRVGRPVALGLVKRDVIPMLAESACWPVTWANDFCGEYRLPANFQEPRRRG